MRQWPRSSESCLGLNGANQGGQGASGGGPGEPRAGAAPGLWSVGRPLVALPQVTETQPRGPLTVSCGESPSLCCDSGFLTQSGWLDVVSGSDVGQ